MGDAMHVASGTASERLNVADLRRILATIAALRGADE